jgi:hypothetical protein
VLALSSSSPDLSRLHWWSRWVTPSAEPKRFSADFFVAELPPGQTPSFDRKETVDELWVSPDEALKRQAAGELPSDEELRSRLKLLADGKTNLSSVG